MYLKQLSCKFAFTQCCSWFWCVPLRRYETDENVCAKLFCLATVSLALLFVVSAYVCGTPIVTLNGFKGNETQTNGVAYHVTKQVNATSCSEGKFISLNGCLPCPNGKLSFPGWTECKPFLNCSEIATQVHTRRRILGGFTKQIWLADWKDHEVVYLKCLRPGVTKRCLRGMTNLEKLQSPFVTRLIGKCYENFEVSYISDDNTLLHGCQINPENVSAKFRR